MNSVSGSASARAFVVLPRTAVVGAISANSLRIAGIADVARMENVAAAAQEGERLRPEQTVGV
jgi:hypothetical protein